MVRTILSLILITAAFCPCAQAQSFTLSHFDTPESMIVDPDDGSYFVSNINGDPSVKDGNGYISKIDPLGKTVIQKFIGTGRTAGMLNAPKGMLIVGRTLFVADIDTVHGFNKETGRPVVAVDFSDFKPKFLNDMASDNRGHIFVSDMLTDRIFKINQQKNYEVTDYTSGAGLGGPNGLLFNPKNGNLMVATFNTGMLLEIDPSGGRHVLKRGLGKLDGIDHDNQLNIYLSSFEKGEIYRITRAGRGALSTLYAGLANPADISVDRRKRDILVPQYGSGQVSRLPIDKEAESALQKR